MYIWIYLFLFFPCLVKRIRVFSVERYGLTSRFQEEKKLPRKETDELGEKHRCIDMKENIDDPLRLFENKKNCFIQFLFQISMTKVSNYF